MLRRLGKCLFPNLPSDIRERRMHTLILVVGVSIILGIVVVLVVTTKQL